MNRCKIFYLFIYNHEVLRLENRKLNHNNDFLNFKDRHTNHSENRNINEAFSASLMICLLHAMP